LWKFLNPNAEVEGDDGVPTYAIPVVELDFLFSSAVFILAARICHRRAVDHGSPSACSDGLLLRAISIPPMISSDRRRNTRACRLALAGTRCALCARGVPSAARSAKKAWLSRRTASTLAMSVAAASASANSLSLGSWLWVHA
jgi:hypothetical protein